MANVNILKEAKNVFDIEINELEKLKNKIDERFTELAKIYGNRLKPLSFSFETGRFLAQNGNKSLQEFIWKNYVPEITINCVQEFTKIINEGDKLL